MTVKVHKEIQIFKRICNHETFADHVEEVRFPQAVCLTGVKVGAVPARQGSGEQATVGVFAVDLTALGAARFARLAEDCTLPESGTKAIRLEATVTDHVVVRGKYHTLPIALYGWAHASKEVAEVDDSRGLVVDTTDNSPGLPKLDQAEELGMAAWSAISALLPSFKEVRTSEKAMRGSPLPADVLPALLGAVEAAISPPGHAPKSRPGSAAAAPSDAAADLAAEMAAGWCRTFAAAPRFGSTAEFSLAGIAAAALLCTVPRHAMRFLAAGGAPALAKVLSAEHQLPRATRYVLAALDALIATCPAAACEALLGWWRPVLGGSPDDDGSGGGAEDPEESDSARAGMGVIPQHGDAAGDEEVEEKGKRSSSSKHEKKEKKAKREKKSKDKDREKEKDHEKDRDRDKHKEKEGDKEKDKAKEQGKEPKPASSTRQATEAAGAATGPAKSPERRTRHTSQRELPAPSKASAEPTDGRRDEERRATDRVRRREDGDAPDEHTRKRSRRSRTRSKEREARYGRDADDHRPRAHNERSREERPRDERPREDRQRDERSREERPRDERQREDRARDERSRSERARDDRPRDDRARDDRRDATGHRDRREREEEERRARERRPDPKDDRRPDREPDADRPRDRERRDKDRDQDRDRRGRDRLIEKEREARSRPEERDDKDSRLKDRPKRARSPEDSKDRHHNDRDSRKDDKREGRRTRSRERHDHGEPAKALRDASRSQRERSPKPVHGRSRSLHRSPSPPSPRGRLGIPPPPALKLQGPEDHDERRSKAFEEEAKAERDAAAEEAAAFGGCYPAILSTMLQLLPRQVAARGARVLARLQAYEAAARFQVAAEDAVRAHAEGGESPLRLAHAACAQAGAALSGLAHALLACPAAGADTKPHVIDAFSLEGVQLDEPFDLDPWLAHALAARRCLPLTAALLHVPGLQAMQEQSLNSAQIQVQLAQPLLSGLGHFLSVLTSCETGLAILCGDMRMPAAILEALDPGTAELGFSGRPKEPAATRRLGVEIAQNLKATLAASQALRRLAASDSKASSETVEPRGLSPEPEAAVQDLLDATSVDVGRTAVVSALLCTPGALDALLRVIKEPIVQDADAGLNDTPHGPGAWRPTSVAAARVLAVAFAEGHPAALGRLAAAAAAARSAAAATLDRADVQRAGGDRSRRNLRALRGRADALLLLREKGLTELVGLVGSLLPALVRPDGQKRGMREVDPKACLALMHNAEKFATAECGLHLLCALLQGRQKSYAGVIISHLNGIEVLERAVRCGTAALDASQADSDWISVAGDALDDAEVLSNRWRAASFLAAALLALSGLLQQLRERGSELNSAQLMCVLLRAHSALCSAPEGFAATLGAMAGHRQHPILQARQAAAAALRCWLGADNWTPDLMTAIFTGGKPLPADGPLVVALAPSEMLLAACLLGDLLPAEWPPSGSLRRAGEPHLPPTHVPLRRAIAVGFEASAPVFRRLVATAAASGSRIFRALLVRLCARAAGLGGGMGVFLAEPLVEELRACSGPAAALEDVRRVLEFVVPLAYRPAMKAAFLELGIAHALARLLRSLAGSRGDAAEATALCTMALEVATVLFNPDVCLDPTSPAPQRALDECPALEEAGSLIAVLLATLTSMAGNAHISKRIIASLAAHAHGRASLRLGSSKWQAQSLGTAVAGAGGSKVAVQWAVSRLWQLGQEEGNEAGMRSICMEVAGQLEEAATSSGEPEDEEEAPSRAPTAQRFAAAVQASVAAGEALGGAAEDDPARGELAPTSSPEALVYDPATRMFWRNVKARMTPHADSQTSSWMMLAGDVDAVPPAAELHEGLTKPKRPHEAAAGGLSASGAAETSARPKPEDAGSRLAATATSGVQDPPPIMAGPGRPKGRPGRAGGSSGRPASMHVDDFEKAAGSGGSASRPAGTAAAQSGGVAPPRPPPGVPKPPPPKGTPPLATGVTPKYPPKQIRPFGAKVEESSQSRASPSSKAAASQSPASASAAVTDLVKSPAAVAELLKDPARLQQLLEKNPALMSVLQAKMQPQ